MKEKKFENYSLSLFACTAVIFCLLLYMPACANKRPVIIKKTVDSTWMLPDSLLLPDSIKHAFFSPDTVKCYHIAYKDTVSEKDIEVVQDYVRDTLLCVLSESQTSVIQYLLLSNVENYSMDSTLVLSPYLPSLEFYFEKEDNPSVSVVLSTLNRSWQMIVGGRQISSFNYVDSRLMERYCSYYYNKHKKIEKEK